MEVIIGALIGLVIGAVISGALIWLVGKLGLGLAVENFGWAMVAGLIIGLLSTLVHTVVPISTGVVGAVINLVIAAVVIFLAGKLLKGLTVDGMSGALLAALAIAAIQYVLGLVLMAGNAG